MKKRMTGENAVNVSLFLVSVFYLTYSVTHYKLGTVRMPKEGFMPLLLGIGMTIISGVLMIQSLAGHGDAANVHLDISWLRFAALAAVSFLYAFSLQTVGYLIGSFLFLTLVFKIAGVKGWIRPVVISLICSVCFYLLFRMALGVMLPRGVILPL
ncbi:MAG: tripartite tricarboxylate transporter TctB family protein [Clostridia bacterium]|nr:tripartite tricarboxylate transporter TctB family protein [Clostridia bacterium]